MPVVTVQLWEGRTLEQKRALVSAITQAMVEHAGADPSGLHVILQEVPPANWGRAGILGVDRGSPAEAPYHVFGLHHLLLQVHDLRRALAFYVDGLAFTIRKRDRLADGRELVVLEQGVGLAEGGPPPPGPVEHIAFRVQDVGSYAQRVEEAGGRLLEGPRPGPYGLSLYFEDPDGNKLEFHE